MALTIKNLGIGSLGDTEKKLTQPPSGKAQIVRNIILVNTDPAAQHSVTVSATVTVGGVATTVQITPGSVVIPPKTQIVLDTELTLSYVTTDSNKVTAVASASDPAYITYIVNGMERDL